HLDRGFAGGLAEITSVLPDVDRLVAERDVVEGGGFAVVAGDRDFAVETLGLEGGDDATGHAVVLGQDRVHLVLVGRQELLHLGLRQGGLPVIGVGLADDLDVAGGRGGVSRDTGLGHAGAEDVGIGVGLVALDDHVVALRD